MSFASMDQSLRALTIHELSNMVYYDKFDLARQVQPGTMIEQRAAVFEVWVRLLCSFAERGLSLDQSLNESSRDRLKSTLVAIVYALSDYIMDHSPAAAVDSRGRDATLRNLDDALAEWIAWLRPLGDESDEVTNLMAAWKPFVNAGDELAGLMKGLGI